MQRVVSIHLNGSTYQLEESGYNALFAYLDARETQLNDDPERAQKMADLERQVEEKIQLGLTPAKSVITSAEIDRIVVDLGPIPAAAAQPDASSSSSQDSPSSSTTSTAGSSTSWSGSGHTHRRLYQIREGAMISGVCVGLSEYLHIDVTLLRILFVIFALASAGWGILAYGLLMFILPRVGTRAQAADSVEGTKPYEWPWDKHGWPWDTHGWPWDQPGWDSDAKRDWREASRQIRQTSREAARQARDAGREAARRAREVGQQARVAYGPAAHGFNTFVMILCVAFGFLWLSFWTRGHFFFGWPFFWGFPHWIGIIFFFMLLRFVFMPFRPWRPGYGYGPYGPYPYAHHPWVSMWNGLAWFLVIIFAFWLAYQYIPEVHDMIREFQTSWNDGFHV